MTALRRAPHARENLPAFAASVAHDTRVPVARTVLALLGALLAGTAGAGCAAHRPPSATPTAQAAPDSSSHSRRKARRGARAGSISSISRRELEPMRVTRVEELLRGRIPGVEVVPLLNGDYAIRIRGATGFLAGSGEPLYVVDGMPVQATTIGGALIGISPDDVERIEVLKDAGSLASYGSQGAFGVVLITTRHRH